MKKRILLGIIALLSFIFNLVWENLQAPLYSSFESYSQHFTFCLIATFGDVAIILGIYFFFILVFKNFFWLNHLNWRKVVLVVMISTVVAFLIEKWALGKYWSYNNKMPTVPYFEIGLSPLLQLIVLPLLIFYLTPMIGRIFTRNYKIQTKQL